MEFIPRLKLDSLELRKGGGNHILSIVGLTISILSVVALDNNTVPVLSESEKRKETYNFLFASSITDKIPLNEAAAPHYGDSIIRLLGKIRFFLTSVVNICQ